MLCQLVIYQIYKHSSQSIFTISVSGCIVMIVKKNRKNFIKVNVYLRLRKKLRFVGFKIFLQYSKIYA